MVSLKEIFFVFLKLGAFTFGGGYAMIPIISEEIKRRKWIDEEVFYDYIAVVQVSPGMIAVNIATMVGLHLRKRVGAIVAVIAVTLPSLIVIVTITSLLGNFSDLEWVQKALNGIILVVILLLSKALLDIGRKSLTNNSLVIYSIGVFTLVTFLHVPTIYVLCLAFIVGTVHTFICNKKRRM